MSSKSITHLFELAINIIKLAPYKSPLIRSELTVSIKSELIFYGLYKQIKSKGKFVQSLESKSDNFIIRKWEAWKEYKDYDIEDCKILYLAFLFPILSNWTSYPKLELQSYLHPLIVEDLTTTKILLKQIHELKISLENNDIIMSKVLNIDVENTQLYEDDDNSSEFSFEELMDNEERPGFSHMDSISTISGFSQLSGPSYEQQYNYNSHEASTTSPLSEKPQMFRRNSNSSVKSVELLPTVPYTPSIGPSTRQTRQPSLSSITPLCLASPVKQQSIKSKSNSQSTSKSSKSKASSANHTRSNSHSSNKSRARSVTGPPPPSGLTDETTAMIQSTSQRLGQGMVLVRRSLQRLQQLEEKVEGVMHSKLQSPALGPVILSPPTHHLPILSPKSSQDSLRDSSLSGWFSKVYNSLL
ncbi:hypothetical protein K502DRAFT_364024 [Neoconidiobolus thromboides FSU 785]|nr:hypothetical protein K502DRAFT_364024 [Neoconidiobolus thromboides FSU 785]